MRVTKLYLLCASFIVMTLRSTQVSAIRFCGRNLADALAVVCNERGYNMAFRSGANPADRRYRRGIVDECCHNGCSLTTLESYCKEEDPSKATGTPQTEVQISKRSDTPKGSITDLFNGHEPNNQEFQEVVKKLAYKHNDLEGVSSADSLDIKSDGTRHHRRKLFGHVDEDQSGRERFFYPLPPEHFYSHKMSGGIKVKRNEMRRNSLELNQIFLAAPESNEDWNVKSEENMIASHHPAGFRHHRERFYPRHRGSDFRKSKELMSSQVGTISPYFLGRTLVSKSSRNTIRH